MFIRIQQNVYIILHTASSQQSVAYIFKLAIQNGIEPKFLTNPAPLTELQKTLNFQKNY